MRANILPRPRHRRWARSADGKRAVIAYFIMGRSANSRNRVFVADGRRHPHRARFDPSKLADPSLIIYAPVRVLGNTTIVTNGDQTDTIYDFLQQGKGFAEALRTRTFEPDAPNFTPRISRHGDAGERRISLQAVHSEDRDGRQGGSLQALLLRIRPASRPARAASSTPTAATAAPSPPLQGEPERVRARGRHRRLHRDGVEQPERGQQASRCLTRYHRPCDTGETQHRIVNKRITVYAPFPRQRTGDIEWGQA